MPIIIWEKNTRKVEERATFKNPAFSQLPVLKNIHKLVRQKFISSQNKIATRAPPR